MNSNTNINLQEENELKKISDLFSKNYKLFIFCLLIASISAFLINKYSIPVYKVSSSILIREKNPQQTGGVNDYLNSSLFSSERNFQNELWVLKSTPVVDQTVRNLDLSVTYYRKAGLKYADAYGRMPFNVVYLSDHPQPLDVRFRVTFIDTGYFQIEAQGNNVFFYNFGKEEVTHHKDKWSLSTKASFGQLIETDDATFMITPVIDRNIPVELFATYAFEFRTFASLTNSFKKNLDFKVVDRLATVIEISLKTDNALKGMNVVNELMSVYSQQNLDRKNHLASITIDYIEKQLDEISDSLSQTEENLQIFRSSNQLLNVSAQASGISEQYLSLQNQMAELVTRKRYYDYVSDYLKSNDNFSNMIVPASLGIQDPLLNSLMSELINAQAQLSNLLKNNQDKNPLVQKLNIQIANIKNTISDNISAVSRTTSLTIDEMDKRIRKTEAEISRLPLTQRKLGNIERKYRLNDAIYNYMLEKRAEAKITKASNLPDQIIIEPAEMNGLYPISPNREMNYLIAVFLGIVLPLGFVTMKSALNIKIEAQEDIENLTSIPVLGRILHNTFKSKNVMYDFPDSTISEAFRLMRTNLDFYLKGGSKKVIMVTSSVEREGKTFIAQNLAMSYAQLGRKTILVDFDLRKNENYFNSKRGGEGLSTWLIGKTSLNDIILRSPHEKLDIILSGVLPPNPSELIALDKTNELIAELKKSYDLIILDTTPLAQVTDAYLLVHHAELKIVVARQNFTLKKVFSLVIKDLKVKKIDHACVVLNDIHDHFDRYGYRYGYKSNGKERISKKIASKV